MIVTGLQGKRSGRRGRPSSAGQFQASINVTPLVDAVIKDGRSQRGARTP